MATAHSKLEALPRGGRTRLAPTPSGFLHAGNALNFLLAARIAEATSASVLLRIDDLDAGRVREAYIRDIFRSLVWLGVTWHEGPHDPEELARTWSQHHRLKRYRSLVAGLLQKGVLYACSCSRTELRRTSPDGRYPGTCRDLAIPFDTPDVVWRLRIDEGTMVAVGGLFGGTRTVDVAQIMGDPVIRQRDGMPAYQIASLADDEDFGITFIVRGEDLLASSACQLHMAGLLDLECFGRVGFVHHPLITDDAGNKLSKSSGATSLQSMIGQGLSPDALWRTADRILDRLLSGGN